VAEQKSKDNRLIDDILKTISKYRNESDSVRKSVYFAQLWNQLKVWSETKLHYDSDEIGREIFGVAKRIINKDKVQQNKTGFINYLNKSLKRAKAEYCRKFESSIIKIPKELLKLETQDDVLKMKEKQFCRKLTEKERLKYITSVQNKS